MNLNINETINSDFKNESFKNFIEESFSPYSSIYFEKGDYVVKTASNWIEVKKSFELRHKVFFNKEENQKKDRIELEWDEYDYNADHLIILNKKEDVIGSYRLISDSFSKNFYTETEFDLNHFKSAVGNKLEIGRACVDSDFRCGIIIDLLWHGILSYVKKNKIRYIFGVSSVWDKSHEDVFKLQSFLEKNHGDSQFKVKAAEESFLLESLVDSKKLKSSSLLEIKDEKEVMKMIPSLLRGYLRAGAKVCGPAIYDPVFSCHDFLTILDMESLSSSFKRRYLK